MKEYRCEHCQESLSLMHWTRSHYCEKADCQRAKVQVYLLEKKKRLAAKLISQSKTLLNNLTAEKLPSELGNQLDKITPEVAVLPANTKPISSLGKKRKNAFIQHLLQIYQDIKTQQPDAHPVYAKRLLAELPEDESQLLGNACATCKGYCCREGQTHAFVDYYSLKSLLATFKEELSEQALVALFSEYFPKKSYHISCVFQGTAGCTLPKKLRSFTCNNFLCESLINYQNKVKQNSSKLTFAAAADKDKISFTSLYDEHNFFRTQDG